jgi:hypothetical protein
MLSNLLSFFKRAFTAPTEQENLDAFIARQQPTSVGDVEYWITVYDRRQYSNRSHNIGFHCR